jgi:hypothetical protein
MLRLSDGTVICTHLTDGAEFIEVRLAKNDLLVAAHLIAYEHSGAFAGGTSSITITKRLDISFTIEPVTRPDENGPRATLKVGIAHRVWPWPFSWIRSRLPAGRLAFALVTVLTFASVLSLALMSARFQTDIGRLASALASERTARVDLEQQLKIAHNAFVEFPLTPLDTTTIARGIKRQLPAGTDQWISLDAAAKVLTFVLPLPPTGYDHYRARLEEIDTRETILVQSLGASKEARQSPRIRWSIPRASIEVGHDYLITVTGINDKARDIQLFRFTVATK